MYFLGTFMKPGSYTRKSHENKSFEVQGKILDMLESGTDSDSVYRSLYEERNFLGLELYTKTLDLYKKNRGITYKMSAQAAALKFFNNLYPWQTQIFELINNSPADDRSIHWIWESIGGTGKSTFIKQYQSLHPNSTIHTQSSVKRADLLYLASGFDERKVVMVDCCRFNGAEEVDYESLELLKGGSFVSSKYMSKHCVGPPVHVMVFANSLPVLKNLSIDRWRIAEITKQKELSWSWVYQDGDKEPELKTVGLITPWTGSLNSKIAQFKQQLNRNTVSREQHGLILSPSESDYRCTNEGPLNPKQNPYDIILPMQYQSQPMSQFNPDDTTQKTNTSIHNSSYDSYKSTTQLNPGDIDTTQKTTTSIHNNSYNSYKSTTTQFYPDDNDTTQKTNNSIHNNSYDSNESDTSTLSLNSASVDEVYKSQDGVACDVSYSEEYSAQDPPNLNFLYPS